MSEDALPLAAAPGAAAERAGPLVQRLSEEAFDEFYREVAPRLFAFLLGATRQRAVAEDLHQESFTRVLASGVEPRSTDHLRAYLYRTAINLLRDRRRSDARERGTEASELDVVVPPAQSSLALDLRRGFATLSPRQQRIVWLAHVEGFDHATIAELAGVRAASVRVMLFRARRKLARALGTGFDATREESR